MRAGLSQPKGPSPGHFGISVNLILNTYTHSAAQLKQDTANTIGAAINQQIR